MTSTDTPREPGHRHGQGQGHGPRHGLWRLAGWALALLVLGLVFLAYAQPSLMQQLGDAVWACF